MSLSLAFIHKFPKRRDLSSRKQNERERKKEKELRGEFGLLRLFVFELQLSEKLFIGRFDDVVREIVEESLNQLLIRSEMLQLLGFVHFQLIELLGQELQQIFVLPFDFVRQALRTLTRDDLLLQLLDRLPLLRGRGEKEGKEVNAFAEKNTRLSFEVFQGDSSV